MPSKVSDSINRFILLSRWEFEESFRFPVLEILTSISLILVLSAFSSSMGGQSFSLPVGMTESQFGDSLLSLSQQLLGGTTNLFAMVIFGVVFGVSVARSFENRRLVTFLTAPAKRSEIILSKFFVSFLVLYAMFGSIMIVDAVILSGYGTLVLPLIITALAILLLQVLFVSSIALLMALIGKNAVVSVFGLMIIYEGLEGLVSFIGSAYALCFSFYWGIFMIVGYVSGPGKVYHAVVGGEELQFATNLDMFLVAVFYRILVVISLVVISVVYSKRLQLD